VVPGGDDWALFCADGAMSPDVRLTLRTDDGALVHMTYGGIAYAVPKSFEMTDSAGGTISLYDISRMISGTFGRR
jgi:hypothetical protein